MTEDKLGVILEKLTCVDVRLERLEVALGFMKEVATRTTLVGKPGGRATMKPLATIGLDIVKTVFQVHGVDAAGQVVVRQRLTRGRVLAFFEKLKPCLVGMEACGNSHYWARELAARGHEVR